MTYIVLGAFDQSYMDITGRMDRRSKDFRGVTVITSWGKQYWSQAYQLGIL